MLTIGITGGIGSGKSTVCRVFRVLGIPVFQADNVARRLQDEDANIRSKLIAYFGPDIYTENNLLNRKKLAGIIFNSPVDLERVNHLIHPAVHKEFENWKAKMTCYPYVLYEAAILFETGSASRFDYTILVVTDEKERLQRVMKRDNLSSEAILQRMRNQMQDSEKIKLASHIIKNNDNQLIIPQILVLDQFFKSN
ncbi:MAG: dephospho-CoA kinase [Prolixibacteraceae bacterium]